MPGPAPVRRSDALPADYPQFLAEIKARIAAARTRATLAVNSELISLYWEIGHEILDREQREGWGAKVINRLAADLRRELPDMTGFSRSNLHYMRSFAAAWPRGEDSNEIVPQAVGQLPWGHIRCLLDKLDDSAGRLWYASQAVENGWSRRVLQAQIATDLRGRQGNALTSFDHALPAPDSELVRDAIKDPYNFEFIDCTGQPFRRSGAVPSVSPGRTERDTWLRVADRRADHLGIGQRVTKPGTLNHARCHGVAVDAVDRRSRSGRRMPSPPEPMIET